MPPLKDHHTTDSTTYPYIFEQNLTIPLPYSSSEFIRINIYRPKDDQPHPVLASIGPYGKDVHYSRFNPPSYAQVNEKQKSDHSAWELPDPAFWTGKGYVVVRGDEPGSGQSNGVLDIFSRKTIAAYHTLIEWCAIQSWSNGKVGLSGVSYYAITQWHVAALRPKGLAAMIPWEGMNDMYRDWARHGGILSNKVMSVLWGRQIEPNQYGRPGRAAGNWCMDTLEGDSDSVSLERGKKDPNVALRENRWRDGEFFKEREMDLGDIEVPMLVIVNWGGISLHLRGGIEGFVNAGSEYKYLRAIVGRHDLPFYYDEEVELQLSFFDAFLKGEDRVGWSVEGKIPKVDLVIRKGDVGVNDEKVEKELERRMEGEWPIERTVYTRVYLTPEKELTTRQPMTLAKRTKLSYRALSTIANPHFLTFTSYPLEKGIEITGHITAHLHVSMSMDPEGPIPKDIDLFVVLRHLNSNGDEISYTGTTGEPVPITQGWLRVSLRKVNEKHEKHREWLPWREYLSADVQPVIPGEVYEVDVEIWPTNVVLGEGESLVLEVASGGTRGVGIMGHDDVEDR